MYATHEELVLLAGHAIRARINGDISREELAERLRVIASEADKRAKP